MSVAQLRSLLSRKLAMPKSEGDPGVELGYIFKIGVQVLGIQKAHKKHISVAQLRSQLSRKLVMPKLEGDLGVESG